MKSKKFLNRSSSVFRFQMLRDVIVGGPAHLRLPRSAGSAGWRDRATAAPGDRAARRRSNAAAGALENEFYLSCGAVDKQLCSSGSGSNKAALSLLCSSPLLRQRALHTKLSESCEERREIETRFRAARAAVAMEGGFT